MAEPTLGRVHLFGIRHHGPGSARSLMRALESLGPDCVLIEGPPDADDILPLAAHAELVPPVAILVYASDAVQRRAVFYPFARFSPEWQAIRFALARNVALHFIDLPQSAQLAPQLPEGATEQEPAPDTTQTTGTREDPLAPIARAVGYEDPERWWDHLVESRSGNDIDVFTALHELMGAVRAEIDAEPPLIERQREAHMRRAIRQALKEGSQRIAVVCGAYHTPALAELSNARADDTLLKGLPKVKTAAAWVPWTYERLTYHSGYGAGVESPMWYELLWSKSTALGAEWLARAARLLRKEDSPVSSAHVIEACRLAEALAAVRDRPVAALSEYRDAAIAVLGNGDPMLLRLIGQRWYFGNELGQVPSAFPAAPLARDLAAEQRRLRIPGQADEKVYDLDLRQPLDRERGCLLRRLRILGIEWGVPARAAGRTKGTFHEFWQVRWQPEFAVVLIEASRYGHTIQQASSARVIEASASAKTIQELVAKLEDVLFADLPEAFEPLVAAIQNSTAISADLMQLLDALPALVEISRYGNVRETDAALVDRIVAGLVPRVLVGIPPAATGIDVAAGRELWTKLKAVNHAFAILGDSAYRDEWLAALNRLSSSQAIQPLIRGYASRLLYDASRLEVAELERTFALALSVPGEATDAALWIEGLLSGSGSILIHDARLRGIVDRWIRDISDEHFILVLPLLRRTFAEFPAAERRMIGEQISGSDKVPVLRGTSSDFDEAAAGATVPILELIWGSGAPR